jgi:hypothetical protein
MADDFHRETVILIAVSGGWYVHTTSMSHRKDLNKLAMPPDSMADDLNWEAVVLGPIPTSEP